MPPVSPGWREVPDAVPVLGLGSRFHQGCGGCGDGAGVVVSLVEMVDVAILWSCNEEHLLAARKYL